MPNVFDPPDTVSPHAATGGSQPAPPQSPGFSQSQYDAIFDAAQQQAAGLISSSGYVGPIQPVEDMPGAAPVPDVTVPAVGPPYSTGSDPYAPPGSDSSYESPPTPIAPPGSTELYDRIDTPGYIPRPFGQGPSGPYPSDVLSQADQWKYQADRIPRAPSRTVDRMPTKVHQWNPYDDRGFTPGQVFKYRTRSRRAPRYSFPGPVLNAPAAPPKDPEDDQPDRERPDRERPPLFPPNDEAPANDTSIRRPPVQQVEPVRVPDPAGVRAPFPQRPELPPVPILAPPTVPKPEVAKWPVQPSSESSVTVPQSVLSPSTPAPVTVPPSTTSTSTTPQTTVKSPSPLQSVITGLSALDILLRLLSGVHSRTLPGLSSAVPSPISLPISTPVPTVTPSPTLPLPVPQPSPLPGLGTQPIPAAQAIPSSIPSGQSCETPRQQQQRRQAKRDACERFITIKVKAHRKRVCAAEAGRLIGRRLGKALGRKIGEAIGLRKARGPARAKKHRTERAVRVTRHGVDVYGVGIEVPKQMRTNIPRLPTIPRRL